MYKGIGDIKIAKKRVRKRPDHFVVSSLVTCLSKTKSIEKSHEDWFSHVPISTNSKILIEVRMAARFAAVKRSSTGYKYMLILATSVFSLFGFGCDENAIFFFAHLHSHSNAMTSNANQNCSGFFGGIAPFSRDVLGSSECILAGFPARELGSSYINERQHSLTLESTFKVYLTA